MPLVVRQEEVKSSCPGASSRLGEGFKLLLGLLVLLSEE